MEFCTTCIQIILEEVLFADGRTVFFYSAACSFANQLMFSKKLQLFFVPSPPTTTKKKKKWHSGFQSLDDIKLQQRFWPSKALCAVLSSVVLMLRVGLPPLPAHRTLLQDIIRINTKICAELFF